MRDYTYRTVPVSQMSLNDIHDCLQKGVEIIDNDYPTDTTQGIIERLKLEIFIRARGLRE